jgi:succinylglutamate desuccinylase
MVAVQVQVLKALPVATSYDYPAPVIKRVVVVGGTHGNEYTGVWCIKAMAHQSQDLKTKYPSLDISTLLANPQAHLENKRFIQTDLNREFSENKLLGAEGLPNTIESLRARELNEILGPKFSDTYGVDLIIDLHSTTSNMGITVIIPEGDAIMAQAAAYVMHSCGALCLMHSIPKRQDRPDLSSAAKHGFTIEVGPVPQGVLRHDMVEKTQMAIAALLEFIEKRNSNDNVQDRLRRMYPSGTVPCFRSAPSKLPGEISGKLVWPCDPDNANFPALMIHKSMQDRDFHLIRKGDPLFVSLDGSVIPYEGSHGDEVCCVSDICE